MKSTSGLMRRRATQRRYEESPKGKATRERYEQSEARRTAKRAYDIKRYDSSIQCRVGRYFKRRALRAARREAAMTTEERLCQEKFRAAMSVAMGLGDLTRQEG